MPDIDPSEFDVSELGPRVRSIEDAEELEAMLAAERDGENRDAVITVIENRLSQVADDDGGDAGDADVDLASMSVADVGNALQSVDDPERLRDLREREVEGENRDTVVRLIDRRLDSVEGGDGDTGGATVDRAPPEERHPELDHPTADKRHVRALDDGTFGDVWVYCETQAGDLLDVSRELLGKARELMDGYNDAYVDDGESDERVVAVLIGDDVSRHADECVALGADVVVVHEDDRLARFRHKPYAELFADMARWGVEAPARDEAPASADGGATEDAADWRDYDEPRYVLFPATNNGRDLSAQVQAELDSGLASDCSGLFIEDVGISNPVKTGAPGSTRTFERVLHMKRPDFSGFEYSTILCLDNPDREFHPQGGSVIPGSFEVPEPDPEREGLVVEHDAAIDDDWFRVEVTDFDRLEGGVDLSGHDVVVAVGRGIGADPTRGMELALELADAFEDAAVGVSRGIVTGSYSFDGHVAEYTGEDRQIGETGQVVAPQVYVAAGISGAVQHKVGCDEADTIVAVNTDPDARIRDWCDYFVEGDLFEVLPRLTDAVEAGGLDVAAVADGGRGGGGSDADPRADAPDGEVSRDA
ncbi:electron transfer flavoprotein subunit alpha/FixB family protein [Halobaculum lipolyticum]|uniref:Electron transfer flavoprotein subunit alpha/FixB family protein n=1 Tax=Halobaculum lipolyticum TaxID=3032001 RepID=A0ABD5W5L7_9EURY|nr:electron transfer flavoprotein subunit alpha/FixB family protein [Halobaculum sp. DT31]